ncbi:hypothetical protein K469DRAFT_672177 [Zopfia rhizophila CBS 207.26]|uniref:Thioesterase/thiol ester dehydrase-isomerase n=1 Tax=Zopfia rhizophila CBS 207.26 TaxID=1314779 RepID=A0A6A6DR08_9PEZI|nr:hypothetical protein K469DRAFT_672177 [Zopfia rhizophila CBS 207.26]
MDPSKISQKSIPPQKPKFSSPLEASSYYHPTSPSSTYTSLRESAVQTAVNMGYDHSSLTECPVDWSADQDANQHVTNAAYARFISIANLRLFETFADALGNEKMRGMFAGKGVGPVTKGYDYQILRQAAYPDSMLVGTRIKDVKPDRYMYNTAVWSLQQQAMVAQCTGWVVFIDYSTQRPVNLLEKGEPYPSLHTFIKQKVEGGNAKSAEWEKTNPPKRKAQL